MAVIPANGSSSNVQIHNLSFVDELLIAALYGDEPLVAVPWLQLISSISQIVSLLVLMAVLLRERRRAKGAAHKDTWELLALRHSGSGAALRVFLLICAVALAFSAIVLLLLCLPIVHVGTFAGIVYVGQGLVDMLPLLWSLQAEPVLGTSTAIRAAVVLGAVGLVRVVAVAGQPPLMAFTPGVSVRCDATCDRLHVTRVPFHPRTARFALQPRTTALLPPPLLPYPSSPRGAWCAEPLHLCAERLRHVRARLHAVRLPAALRRQPPPQRLHSRPAPLPMQGGGARLAMFPRHLVHGQRARLPRPRPLGRAG